MTLQPPSLGEILSFSVDKLSAADVVRLGDVGAERTRRRMESLRLYEPMPEQKRFHESMASERLLRGGNRAGKSIGGFMEDARVALGEDPHGKYPSDRPLRLWLICYDEGQIGRTAHRLLFLPGAFNIIPDEETGRWRVYRPWDSKDAARREHCRPAPPLIPPRFAPPDSFAWKDKGRRIFNVCRLKFPPGHPMQGTEIHAFPSGGEPPSGDPVDHIHIDEDLKYARHVAEYQSRLSDTKGRLIWTARPHMANNALINMSKRAEEQQELARPDVEEFVLTFSGNPFQDPDEKRKRLESWSRDERAARDQGEFIDTVLMYPEFNVEVHGIPRSHEPDKLDRMITHGQVPARSTRYMIVDPGRVVTAVLFLFVPPPHFGDYVVAYDELYLFKCNARRFAEAAATKVGGHSFYAFIIDDHGSRCHETGSGLTVRQQYSDELRQRNIRSQITGHGFIRGSDDILSRAMEFSRWLTVRPDGTTRFRMFTDKLPHFRDEILAYRKRITADEAQDKPIAVRNHLSNCAEYAAAYSPKYHPPLEHVGENSAVYREFQEWRDLPTKQSGTDRFLYGEDGGGIHLGPKLAGV